MQVEEALRRFVVQLDADGRSPHTRRQYERHIRALARWLCENNRSERIEDIDHETVALFLASPRARTTPRGTPKRANSTNALRTSLRCFFGYLHAAGDARVNAARLVRRAICSPGPPRALSDDEVERLLEVLTVAQGRAARRDHLLVDLLLKSGVRIGSALALEERDIDLDQCEIRLRHAKGDRVERVFFGRELRDHLVGFVAGRDEGPLFTRKDGARISMRHAQRRITAWMRRAGVRAGASAHCLRHTMATRVYRETGDIVLVQAALTHRSIVSTLVYARVNEGRLRAALNA